MKTDLELAKEALTSEFDDAPYTRENPLGNAGASRKIQKYVIACVDAGDASMWDWFETNIIEKFHVTGVERGVLEFARDVLLRARQ